MLQILTTRASLAFGLWVALAGFSLAQNSRPSKAEAEFFEKQVQPILTANCFKCHGASENKGGLRLISRAAILQGGDTGPAIDLEAAQESLLLSAINYDGYEMPPKGKLPEKEIAILTRWVELGLPYPKESEIAVEEAHDGPPPVDEKAKQFWSYRKLSAVKVPSENSDWVQTPIDAFILHKLKEEKLSPSPAATKTQLLRRAYYNLIGIPPSPEAVEAFLHDDSDRAFEQVIDQLLESPHYGERWARHWLDLVRYAETNSYERDGPKPFVWRYRDYVIRSFNEDKPYNQFILEQLAGDELPKVTSESIVATGYYRLGLWQDEPVDPKQELFEDLDDLVRTTGEVFLGITIGCARCHDHKLDPITQRDYYGFLAFFRNVRRFGARSHESVMDASVRAIGTEAERLEYEAAVRDHEQRQQTNREQLREVESKLRKDLVGVEKDEWKTEDARIEIAKKRIGGLLTQEAFDEYVALFEERKKIRAFRPPGLDQALCVKEHGRTVPTSHVLIRGNAHAEGDPVEPRFPEVLSPPAPSIELPAEEVPSSGRRLALARWIASPDNPLTARVIVNRIWQQHFGRGIVESANDFGFQGQAPTHRELLDWLAAEFVRDGWKMKKLHKLIMMSSAYQMSSAPNEDAYAQDPTNRFFWRYNMRRLSAEEIRDSVLAVNGSLNTDKMFGPSIYVPIPQEVLAGQSRPGAGWGKSSPEDQDRRSIYIHVKRSLIVPMLATFDGADTDSSCPVRFNTTQPTQSLAMLNSGFVNREAEVFAEYLSETAGKDPAAQVKLALARVLQRPVEDLEVEIGTQLLADLSEEFKLSPADALKRFCVTCLNLNEFVYLD